MNCILYSDIGRASSNGAHVVGCYQSQPAVDQMLRVVTGKPLQREASLFVRPLSMLMYAIRDRISARISRAR